MNSLLMQGQPDDDDIYPPDPPSVAMMSAIILTIPSLPKNLNLVLHFLQTLPPQYHCIWLEFCDGFRYDDPEVQDILRQKKQKIDLRGRSWFYYYDSSVKKYNINYQGNRIWLPMCREAKGIFQEIWEYEVFIYKYLGGSYHPICYIKDIMRVVPADIPKKLKESRTEWLCTLVPILVQEQILEYIDRMEPWFQYYKKMVIDRRFFRCLII